MAHLLVFALLGFSVRLFAAETSKCKYNEYIIESESGILTCLTCHKCPAGFGLFPQCGARIKDNEIKNECKPCLRGKTYSANDDISSCEPCDTCSNHQTIVKKCTLYSDSQCKDICAKGFYFEDLTGDCQPCTWCCRDGNIKVKSGCKEMPLYKQCDVNTAKNCKPKCQNDQYVVPGRKGGGYCKDCEVCPPLTVRFPQCGSVVENINNISCREGRFKGWLAVILAGGIVVVICMVVASFLWWKFCRRVSPGSNFTQLRSAEENGECGATAEGQSSQQENSVASGNSVCRPGVSQVSADCWPTGPSGNNNGSDTHDQNHVVTEQGVHGSKSLESLAYDLSNSVDKIFQRLDTRIQGAGRYDYEIIGNHFGYDHFEIKSKFERCDGSPSRAMLQAIAVCHPELTVEEFARLVEAKTLRNDVVQLLRAYDRVSPKESV
ncbi:uncharacterized protein [Montipora foliosa]|uniref:uncharacterized protein isoform X2 n=1 Tax=Montipora foliosa TaxID=591990 RepID=UPI0035F17D84